MTRNIQRRRLDQRERVEEAKPFNGCPEGHEGAMRRLAASDGSISGRMVENPDILAPLE